MEITARMQTYEQWLRERGFSPRTVASYVWAAAHFERTYGEVTGETLREYREHLVATSMPNTANQRIQAINCYLLYLGEEGLRLRSVRVQQTTYLRDTVEEGDFLRLTAHLRDGYARDYHAVRIMATTGMRVSELLSLSIGDLRKGCLDVSSKGKLRRIHIPGAVATEALAWAEAEGRYDGVLFLNRYGRPLSSRGLSGQLKARAAECGVDGRLVHPHAFRHLFARRFLEAGGDIAFLADLLGHSSIETTRVYLRRTASEQREELERLVSW